ncbi:MAG TPA: SnoaL-like domain-containing protein [Puia sp.]|nr:SnoaL-like domain-containing protein [Puia sp.]
MSIEQIAKRLTELCRQGQYETAQKELYAANAISIEPENSPAPGPKKTEGLDNIIIKGQQFQSMVEEVHGGSVSDPVIAGNYFSVAAVLDMTYKGMGRQKMEEICLYKVQDGKIVSEQFFY